ARQVQRVDVIHQRRITLGMRQRLAQAGTGQAQVTDNAEMARRDPARNTQAERIAADLGGHGLEHGAPVVHPGVRVGTLVRQRAEQGHGIPALAGQELVQQGHIGGGNTVDMHDVICQKIDPGCQEQSDRRGQYWSHHNKTKADPDDRPDDPTQCLPAVGGHQGMVDRNYGGMLIIFDRLFGTYVEEADEEPVDYGITRQVHSYNPLWPNLHEWVDMFRDVLKPGPLWLRLKHLWSPPRWQRPDNSCAVAEAQHANA